MEENLWLAVGLGTILGIGLIHRKAIFGFT